MSTEHPKFTFPKPNSNFSFRWLGTEYPAWHLGFYVGYMGPRFVKRYAKHASFILIGEISKYLKKIDMPLFLSYSLGSRFNKPTSLKCPHIITVLGLPHSSSVNIPVFIVPLKIWQWELSLTFLMWSSWCGIFLSLFLSPPPHPRPHILYQDISIACKFLYWTSLYMPAVLLFCCYF